MAKIGNFLSKFVKELFTGMPLSLFRKLSDGKLSPDELMELTQEITQIAVGCLIEIYNEDNDPVDVPQVNVRPGN